MMTGSHTPPQHLAERVRTCQMALQRHSWEAVSAPLYPDGAGLGTGAGYSEECLAPTASCWQQNDKAAGLAAGDPLAVQERKRSALRRNIRWLRPPPTLTPRIRWSHPTRFPASHPLAASHPLSRFIPAGHIPPHPPFRAESAFVTIWARPGLTSVLSGAPGWAARG